MHLRVATRVVVFMGGFRAGQGDHGQGAGGLTETDACGSAPEPREEQLLAEVSERQTKEAIETENETEAGTETMTET